jgi:acylphosphatase
VIRTVAIAVSAVVLLLGGCGGGSEPPRAPPRSTIGAVRRVRLQIRGLVQGVSYRASATSAARRIGVTGWVRNQPDGSVVAEVQGSPADVDAMIDWCKDGPPSARVDGVDVTDIAAVTGEAGFSTQR